LLKVTILDVDGLEIFDLIMPLLQIDWAIEYHMV